MIPGIGIVVSPSIPHSHRYGRNVHRVRRIAAALLNASTSHLADMMIQGNTKGIVELMKAVKSNQSVQKEYYEIAQELMDFEEKNIEKLKAYLR